MVDARELTVGDKAPDFTLNDQWGQALSLSAREGDDATLLVFYPFAFSGLCSGELEELNAAQDRLSQLGVKVATVSCDPMFSLKAWTEQEKFEFPMLSDFWPHGETARTYGTFDEERGCALRASFLIDAAGVVRWCVYNGIGDVRSLTDYIAAAQELQAK